MQHAAQGLVVDHLAVRILTDNGRFHAIVEQLLGRAPERFKGTHMHAQHGVQVLIGTTPIM